MDKIYNLKNDVKWDDGKRVDDTLESACLILRKKKFNALPVVSNAGELVGILTVHDVLEAFIDYLKLEYK